MKRFLRKIGMAALDALYPSRCELCQTPLAGQETLCAPCGGNLPRISAPSCTTCGEPFDGRIDGAFACPNCSGMRFAFEFTKPVLRRDPQSLDLVHALKYGRRIDLVHSLGGILREALDDPRLRPAIDGLWPLVPVPLHGSRIRSRHFNQAEELAVAVSRLTGMPVLPALRRVRKTGTQTALGRRARQKNLRGAFEIVPRGTLPAACASGVVLVDDVFTTGSTLHECAKTLRNGGCPVVVAMTLMRG